MMTIQILSTLNLKRMSCKACLFAGRLSMNDNDDTDDREETTSFLQYLKLDLRLDRSDFSLSPIRIGARKNMIMCTTFPV